MPSPPRVALVPTPECVSVHELDSSVVRMNKATETMLNASFEQLRGERLFDLYPDLVGSALHAAFARVVVVDGAAPQAFEAYYARFEGW